MSPAVGSSAGNSYPGVVDQRGDLREPQVELLGPADEALPVDVGPDVAALTVRVPLWSEQPDRLVAAQRGRREAVVCASCEIRSPVMALTVNIRVGSKVNPPSGKHVPDRVAVEGEKIFERHRDGWDGGRRWRPADDRVDL